MRTVHRLYAACATVMVAAGIAFALQNGVGRTPPMGWSSWNAFRVNINEQLIKETADSMVSSGMRNAGYQYVNVDDGWGYGRDAAGTVTCRTDRFPSGMKSLAAYLHGKGLKAGIYTDAGTSTCGMMYDNEQIPGYGAYGHYVQDMRTYFVDWGFDDIKVDWCGGQDMNLDLQTAYTGVRDAILATGKPVFFNVCSWAFPGDWVIDVGNSWRIAGDIGIDYVGWCDLAETAEGLAPYNGPGHWNDPDMMQIGMGGTLDEDKTHFSLWCIVAAPLIAGNDLRSMSQQTRTILTNKEVIAIDQDSLGICGTRVVTGTKQVWVKPLADSGRAVLLQNEGTAAATMSCTRTQIGMPSGGSVRDLWAHKDLGTMGTSFSASVPAHGVVMIRISGGITAVSAGFAAVKSTRARLGDRPGVPFYDLTGRAVRNDRLPADRSRDACGVVLMQSRPGLPAEKAVR